MPTSAPHLNQNSPRGAFRSSDSPTSPRDNEVFVVVMLDGFGSLDEESF